MTGILLALLLVAPDPAQAERAYRAGRYEEALARFRAILARDDVAHGPVLYDMGNCAFRLRRYAEAVLHYRRALLRMPRDREVVFNLRLAERRLGLDPGTDGSPGALISSLLAAPTTGELLLLVGALQTIGLVGFVLLPRRRGARAVMVLLVALALVGAGRLVRDAWFPPPPDGVILAEVAPVRPEPHRELPVRLRLEAGDRVRVEELSDRWARIAHPRGSGWVERDALGVVD